MKSGKLLYKIKWSIKELKSRHFPMILKVSHLLMTLHWKEYQFYNLLHFFSEVSILEVYTLLKGNNDFSNSQINSINYSFFKYYFHDDLVFLLFVLKWYVFCYLIFLSCFCFYLISSISVFNFSFLVV